MLKKYNAIYQCFLKDDSVTLHFQDFPLTSQAFPRILKQFCRILQENLDLGKQFHA